MKQSINQLKQWFETGDYPTQQQFYDWMESFWHKDELIPMASVQDLITTLQGKADVASLSALIAQQPVVVLPQGTYTWDQPQGVVIDKVLIESDVDLNITLGTAANGNDLIDAFDITGADGYGTYNKDIYARIARTIYFSGAYANSIIKLYIR